MTIEFVTDPALVDTPTLAIETKRHGLYIWWRKGLRFLVARLEPR